MRIVGGRHRGRRLLAPTGRNIRPTSDRTRESLFNILAHSGWGSDEGSPIDGAVVLDAFCGTGALGLEALSRGAARGLFLDKARSSLETARRNAEELRESANSRFVIGDAAHPPPAPEPATLVFLDPPYAQDLAPKALDGLARAGWLAPGALCVVEVGAADAFAAPPAFETLEERSYSQARVIFLRRVG